MNHLYLRWKEHSKLFIKVHKIPQIHTEKKENHQVILLARDHVQEVAQNKNINIIKQKKVKLNLIIKNP